MTGTPIANRPYDIWAQIRFLDKGKSIKNSFLEFKKGFDLSNDLTKSTTRQKEFERHLQTLWSRISDFSVRETKNSACIELPEKIIETIVTDWELQQLDLYQQIRDNLKAIVIRNGMPTEDNAEDILKRLLRLVQIASNPNLVDDRYGHFPGKWDPLLNLILEIKGKKEKCIIWTSFTDNVDWLATKLQQYGSCRVHGKLSFDRRNKAIKKFKLDPETRILVATPGAAKEGLTLTVANHVIFYDRTFSLDDYLQAQDRIHRISQIRSCYVYNLIMEDSIDEWVDTLLHAKRIAAQLAQGDISYEYYKSQMTYEFNDILKNILKIGTKA